MPASRLSPLAGARVAITRPVGTGDGLARRVRALGGTPLSLPGSSLRAALDAPAARVELKAAMNGDIAIFTSPAAVRYARQLATLRGQARIVVPGQGTLAALRRAGVHHAIAPLREDSEGMLDLPCLQAVQGRMIGIVGAAGGRGLLAQKLSARGAAVRHAHVYRRLAARLDQRHAQALRCKSRAPLFVLVSSAEALQNILRALPADAAGRLLAGCAVTSSARLAAAAHAAGFAEVLRAAAASADALLAAITDASR